MKRLFGGLLMLGGAVCTYFFATRAMFAARGSMGAELDPALPFRSLGLSFPADALLLLGALWGFILGLWCIVMGFERADGSSGGPRGGRIARMLLLNGLLLASSLFTAWVGAKAGADPLTLTVFALLAAAQIAIGAVLLVLALFERPKGFVSLALGALVWLGGTGLGVLAFLWGGN